jgi:hypothetical protein
MSDGTTGTTTFDITLPQADKVSDGEIVAERYVNSNHRVHQVSEPMENPMWLIVESDRYVECHRTVVCYLGLFAFVAYAPRAMNELRVSRELWREIEIRLLREQRKFVIPCPDRYFESMRAIARFMRRDRFLLLLIGAVLVLLVMALLIRQW